MARAVGVILTRMTHGDPKADLHRYLRDARSAVVWKLEGLSEYDVRRPLVPTGTNLLGLVKHLATVEWGPLRSGVRPALRGVAALGGRRS